MPGIDPTGGPALLNSLPVDLLVVGGGFAGIAAAITAARAGARVLLTEQRTTLGAELITTLRPWLTATQLERLTRTLGPLQGVSVLHGEEHALIPDRFKIALEDLLLDAGVQLLYGLYPIRWRGRGPYEVVFAAKAGEFRVPTARVLDATREAHLARWSTPAQPRETAAPWRTLELTGVNLPVLQGTALALPPELATHVRVHLGHAPNGHVLIEHALPEHLARAERNAQELQARPVSLAVARYLIEHHEAFQQARVAGTSQELWRHPAHRVRVTTGQAAPQHGWPAQAQAFRQSSGLWMAGPAADLDDRSAHELASDVGLLAELGSHLGPLVLQERPSGGLPDHWESPPQHHRTTDVLVVGGGTSGVAAAIGAARQGASVVLTEMHLNLGGTGTVGGVDSYWFGRRVGFSAEVSACTEEQHRWMNWPKGAKWNVEGKMVALLELARREGVQVLLGAMHLHARLSTGGRVSGASFITADGVLNVSANVTVDATGDGDVAVTAGAQSVYGSAREGNTMWYSLAPHPRPGLTKNNFTSNVDLDDPVDYTRAVLAGRRRFVGHDHGNYLAPRESRHITGDVRLTLTDQLSLRRWPDVVNVHFSNHDFKGHSTSDWLRVGLIPPNLEVEIPYRALLPRGVSGLLVTGKALSAEHDALPAIRMQADLENLGFACGVAAALSAQRSEEPRDLPVEELQTRLTQSGILPAERRQRMPNAPPEQRESQWQSWIEQLDDTQPLYRLSFMDFHEVQREPIAFVQICTAGPGILPLLRAQLGPDSPRRVMAARALAWYGDGAGVPVLLEAIHGQLSGAELPHRVAMPFTQASPDHGAMPDLAYLLHTLALTRDPRSIDVINTVVARLDPTEARLHDPMSGLFHYVDAVCDIAERLGDSRCLDSLQFLQKHPFLSGHTNRDVMQPDFFQERLAMLELIINRAAARCGDRRGLQMLMDYLHDTRRPLARHAERELKAITGTLQTSPDAWQRWLNAHPVIRASPWLGRSDSGSAEESTTGRT